MLEMSESDDFSTSFVPRQVVRQTRFGAIRTCGTLHVRDMIFLFTAIVSLITTLVLSIYTLVTLENPTSDTDFYFAIVIIINIVFCIYYAIYGIYWERSFEILVFCIAVIIFISYLIANFVTTEGWTNTIKIVRLVVASVLAPVCLSLGFIIIKDFEKQNNLIVRTVGADSEMATTCKWLFTLQAALKLDMQMGATFVVLLCGQYIDTTDIILITVEGMLIAVWFTLGMFASRYEIRWLMYAFFPLGIIGGPTYIIYRMVIAVHYIHGKTNYDVYIGVATMAVACVYLVVRVTCFFLGVIVCRNFGKGLKERFNRARTRTAVNPHALSTT